MVLRQPRALYDLKKNTIHINSPIQFEFSLSQFTPLNAKQFLPSKNYLTGVHPVKCEAIFAKQKLFNGVKVHWLRVFGVRSLLDYTLLFFYAISKCVLGSKSIVIFTLAFKALKTFIIVDNRTSFVLFSIFDI